MVRATLALVANDEADVIKRCLTSVKHLVDQIYISFNGSMTDGTPEAIKEWEDENGVPVTLWYDDWKGYGKTKTRGLDKVRSEIETDYIVFLDADEVFITDPNNTESYPTVEDADRLFTFLNEHKEYDYVSLNTHWCGRIYSRWQIVRNNQRWVWHLPYQEILEGEVSNNSYFCSWLINYSRREGHNSKHPEAIHANIARSEKFIRKHPDHKYYPRMVHELAKAYRDIHPERSVELHKLRIRLTAGFNQERYNSCLALARLFGSNRHKCVGTGKDIAKRRKYLLKAIDIVPNRLEAYYKLMRDAIRAEKHREAVGWGLMAPASRHVPMGAYFPKSRVYEGGFDHWLGVCTYHGQGALNPSGVCDLALCLIGTEACLRSAAVIKYENVKKRSLMNIDHHAKLLERGRKAGVCSASFDMIKTVLADELFVKQVEATTSDLPPISSEPASSSSSHESALIPQASSSSILSGSLTINRHNMNLIVIDGFYPRPDEIRSKALSMDFNVTGTYPGKRTVPYRLPGTKEAFEAILNTKITYWPDGYNGSFQIVTEENKSWIHRDKTDWSVVVFLTPDAPHMGGTKLYRHKMTGLRSASTPELEKILSNDSNDEAAWDLIDRIGNIYNRAILFRGRMSHMSDLYFGKGLEDGRLFQTFFFDTKV